MAIFTPPYRPTQNRKPFVIRQQQRQRKRKRDDHGASVEDGHPSSPEPQATTSFHPVNKTDPYYIAGLAREGPLPPAPFPHAAVKETKARTRPIEEELAALIPPLYVPSAASPEESSTSLRRRHLDNLTTILHRCMLKGDWPRAHRAWSLLIRTEIEGRGIDVRRNGRWTIGAELLMRRDTREARQPPISSGGDEPSDPSDSDHDADHDHASTPIFSDEGFKLARDYYERLIIQYPYTRSTMHSLNATAIYPALFNVWIYQVQERSKCARRAPSSRNADGSSDMSEAGAEGHAWPSGCQRVKRDELEHALPIADRMDELLISPPYDTNAELKRLRRMVASWIADLYDVVGSAGNGRIDLDRAARERDQERASE